MTLVHDVGAHGAGGGFAVRSCKAQSLVCLGQCAEYLRPLLYLKAVFPEVFQLMMCLRNSGCVDNKACLRVLTCMRNLLHIFFIVYKHALFLKLVGQCGWSLVVSSYHHTFMNEVAGDGTHANASSPNEINRLDFCYVHFSSLLLSYEVIRSHR